MDLLSSIFAEYSRCKGLKIFTVEFKDGLMVTPPVSYSGTDSLPLLSSMNSYSSGTALDTLVHVQLGQNVQNSAIATIISYCPHLRHIHCNRCPDLQDMDLAACVAKSVNIEGTLECFYVYEAPQLTFASFQLLIESFPGLQRFGNLTRWAVNCEGIQQVVRNIRENNIDVEILCGSHWFSSPCAKSVSLAPMY